MAQTIAELNDAFRRTLRGGPVTLTSGVAALDEEVKTRVLRAVMGFDTFTEDNDPYGEHDFGRIEIDGTAVFWKIDYFDKAMEYASPDPADPEVTTRVLTIMLAEEY